METQDNNEMKARIQSLEQEIVEYHVPRALRPIGKTLLSTMPLLFSLGVHTAWKHISPETYEQELANINHTLAGAVFVAYNGLRVLTGKFDGLGKKYKQYGRAEDELTILKTEYKNQTKGSN